jgi:NAD(P)-dependent dehydrogenase (short-subunit alcohol dehydrogenase family)
VKVKVKEAISAMGKLLEGKVALVTGASSGLGYHFAQVLGDAGARVVIAARRTEKLSELSAILTAASVDHLVLSLDVTQVDKIAEAFDTCEQAGFAIDILVNNAGINVPKASLDMTPADYDQIFDTNTKAAFFMACEAARRMVARGVEGRIINIASVGAQNVLTGLTVYCMSKSAIAMMTRSLAREFARQNININGICPGYIETEINDFWWKTDAGQKQIKAWPKRRLGNPDDLDGALLLLSGPAGKGMTGTLITVDDGQYI